MGMYNTVQCDMPLPDTPEGWLDSPRRNGTYRDYGFQTKSLGENVMDNYRITAEGILERQEYHYEKTGRWFVWDFDTHPMSEAKVYVDPPTEPVDPASFEGPYAEQNRIEDGWQRVNFNGAFNFYANGANDEWFEFVAYVENGKVFKLIRDHDREWRLNKAIDRQR